MFITWFFVVTFYFDEWLFTPIESMPKCAQLITELLPIKYFVEVMRMVMLKGLRLMAILKQLVITTIYAFFTNGLAVWSYN